jgi:hypothetical protein
VKPTAIEHLAGGGLRQVADGGDPASDDADIPLETPVLVHDDAALEQEIEGLGHGKALR